MADRTQNFGLARLGPGEPLNTFGGSFTGQDRTVIDRLLKVGAVTHKHDGHAPMADPAAAPALAVDNTQGTIPADTTVNVVYTLVDADGGETLPSPIASVTTDAPIEPPALPPDITIEYDLGGDLTIDTYQYAVTLVDDSGGETPAGPPVEIVREPGGATARIRIEGLMDILNATAGASGWRLYRSIGAGSMYFLASGNVDDVVVDDGSLCPDCGDVVPPTNTNTTQSTNSILVTVPDNVAVEAAAAIRLYMTDTGDFNSPSFVEQLPVAERGIAQLFTSIVLEEGAPPDVSTSIGGASPIDESQIANLRWRAPVADASELPGALDGNVAGDVRVTLDDLLLHVWDGDSWEPQNITGGAVTWRGTAATLVDLPAAGNGTGDVRLVIDEMAIYGWDGAAWVKVGGGGGAELDLGTYVNWLDANGDPVAGLTVDRITIGTTDFDEDFEGGLPGVIPSGAYGVADDGSGTNQVLIPLDAWDNSQINTFLSGVLGHFTDNFVARTLISKTADWSTSGVFMGFGNGGVAAQMNRQAQQLELNYRPNDGTFNGAFNTQLAAPVPITNPPADGPAAYYTVTLQRIGTTYTATLQYQDSLGDFQQLEITGVEPGVLSGGSVWGWGITDRWSDDDDIAWESIYHETYTYEEALRARLTGASGQETYTLLRSDRHFSDAEAGGGIANIVAADFQQEGGTEWQREGRRVFVYLDVTPLDTAATTITPDADLPPLGMLGTLRFTTIDEAGDPQTIVVSMDVTGNNVQIERTTGGLARFQVAFSYSPYD